MLIELGVKIKKQNIFAWICLIFGIIYFVFSIILLIHIINSSKKITEDNSISTWVLICFYIPFVGLVIIWILAIINAISINMITRNSTILIIFTIFNFFGIAMLIATNLEKKKLKSGFYETHYNVSGSIDKIIALKQALINNIISSKEYATKLSELDKKEDNKNN